MNKITQLWSTEQVTYLALCHDRKDNFNFEKGMFFNMGAAWQWASQKLWKSQGDCR